MADSDKIVTITPNTGVATTHPEIKFVGKDDSPMYLKVLDDNTLSFEGTEGQVFSISPTMSSGDIFSVNDISGIQSIAVNADGTVALAPTSGNVGVGTNSPKKTLHISDGSTSGITGGSTAALLITDNDNPRIYFEDVGEGSDDKVMDIMYNSEYLSFNSLNDAASAYNVQNIMVMHRDGNVGINDSAPDKELSIIGIGGGNADVDIARTSGATINLQAQSAAGIIGTTTNHSLQFKTNGSVRMTVEPGGDVGIGTTNPDSTLHLTSGSGYLKFETSGSVGSIKSDFNLDLYADDTDGNSSGYQNIRFFPAGTEAMRIAHDGNVGIGTTNPSAPLHIYTTSTTEPSLLIENDEAQAPADAIIRLVSAGGSDTWIDFIQNTYGQLEITGGGSTRRQILTVDDPDTADACTISLNKEHFDWNTQIFGDSSTPAIFVEGGNSYVGIGTTSPDKLLHVVGSANDETVALFSTTGGTSGSTQGTVHIGMTHFSSDANPSVSLTAQEISTGSYQANLLFNTRSADSDSAPTERMMITSGGKVGIGTSSPDALLEVAGTLQGQRTVITAVSSNTTLTDGDSGTTVYWTGGTLTLPATAIAGQQFVVINNTGGSATPALGTSNAIVSGWTAHAAMADETARTYISPATNKWLYIG